MRVGECKSLDNDRDAASVPSLVSDNCRKVTLSFILPPPCAFDPSPVSSRVQTPLHRINGPIGVFSRKYPLGPQSLCCTPYGFPRWLRRGRVRYAPRSPAAGKDRSGAEPTLEFRPPLVSSFTTCLSSKWLVYSILSMSPSGPAHPNAGPNREDDGRAGRIDDDIHY